MGARVRARVRLWAGEGRGWCMRVCLSASAPAPVSAAAAAPPPASARGGEGACVQACACALRLRRHVGANILICCGHVWFCLTSRLVSYARSHLAGLPEINHESVTWRGYSQAPCTTTRRKDFRLWLGLQGGICPGSVLSAPRSHHLTVARTCWARYLLCCLLFLAALMYSP
jgi:hypothetical protein